MLYPNCMSEGQIASEYSPPCSFPALDRQLTPCVTFPVWHSHSLCVVTAEVRRQLRILTLFRMNNPMPHQCAREEAACKGAPLSSIIPTLPWFLPCLVLRPVRTAYFQGGWRAHLKCPFWQTITLPWDSACGGVRRVTGKPLALAPLITVLLKGGDIIRGCASEHRMWNIINMLTLLKWGL